MYQKTKEKWHAMRGDEAVRRLKTDEAVGLSRKVWRTRLESFGKNELFLPYPKDVRSCARRILTDPSLLVLVLVCLIALCFARFATALTVLFVLAVSCTVSVVAYVKTNRLKEQMSARSEPSVRVLRDGEVSVCAACEVVPGDILLLGKGDIVPCDARLLVCEALEVSTCVFDEQGKASYVQTPKNARIVYNAVSDVAPLKRENMIYAGSVVTRGDARAVVTETGKATYAASQMGGHAFAMQVGEPAYLAPMRRCVNRYSMIVCACILPLVLIGIVVGKGRIDLLDALLLTLSLVVSSMSEQVLSMGRIICACAVLRAALDKNESDRAVIKNYHAMDALSRVDEVILFGRSAVSDGCLHPYAVYTEDKLYIGPNMKTGAVKACYEAVYLYEACASDPAYRNRFVTNASWQDSVREMGDMLGFDRERAAIKTVYARPLEASSAWVELSLRQGGGLADRRFRIHRCDEPEPLLQCNARRVGRDALEMDREQCKQLFDIYCQLKNQGTEVCAYIREEGGLAIFEGIVSFREAYAPGIAEMLARLKESHVRVSLFLPEEGRYHLNYLLSSGWIDTGKDAVSASRLHAADKTLADVFDQRRVFFGFSKQEVTEQIERCRAQGRVVASLGIDVTDRQLAPADVVLGCLPTLDGEDTVGQTERGRADTAATLRSADVLICRAGPQGGGMAGVLQAICTARSVHVRMMLAMQYLLVAQLLRMTLVALPLLLGTAIISPTLLLISGVWVDLAFVLVCAFYYCTPKALLNIPNYRHFFKAPLKSRPDWLCATLVCGLFTVLSARILSGTGVLLRGSGLELYAFLSLLSVQCCLIFCLLKTACDFSGHWSSRTSALLVLAVLVGLLLPVVFVPAIAGWFGAGGTPLLAALLALLSPLYLLGSYFLSVNYRQKIWQRVAPYAHATRRWLVKSLGRGAYNKGKKGSTDGQNGPRSNGRR